MRRPASPYASSFSFGPGPISTTLQALIGANIVMFVAQGIFPVLTALLDRAAKSSRRCVTAVGNNGEPEPLCAVYHRDCLPVLAGALRDKRFKMKDLVKELDAEAQVVEPGALANVNTPEEWREFEEG